MKWHLPYLQRSRILFLPEPSAVRISTKLSWEMKHDLEAVCMRPGAGRGGMSMAGRDALTWRSCGAWLRLLRGHYNKLGAPSGAPSIHRVGLARFPQGGTPNPGRDDLFIDPPEPYPPNPFCFSAARQRSCVYEHRTTLRRAAEKQKGGYYSRLVSINRSPLTGFGHSTAAEGGIESLLFLRTP
jgi:hypothetical protein